jgi:hypothetical protein
MHELVYVPWMMERRGRESVPVMVLTQGMQEDALRILN